MAKNEKAGDGYKEIEKGVYVKPALIQENIGMSGDVYLYKLREMSDEQIERFGLRKYLKNSE